MKATVNKVMMSLMLAACVLCAQAVSAQGRSGARGTIGGSRANTSAPARTSSNDSRQATVSRSAATQTRSTQSVSRQAPAVERKNSTAPAESRTGNSGTRSQAVTTRSTGTSTMTHNVERTSQQQRNVTTGRATMGAEASRNTGVAVSRPNSAGVQDGTRAGTRGGMRGNDNRGDNNKDRNGGTVRPNDKNGTGHNGGDHFNDRGGSRPGGNKGGNVGTRGTDVKPRVDNKPPRPNKPYNLGPAEHRNQYRWNYMHSNWSRPLPPPVRVHRPAPLRFYRPVVPVHYRPLAGAPVIDRILGITFGTYMDVSLSHLYYNGYDIDGYDSGIVYLRNVAMLNLNWHDVMLNYDDYGRLVNAQFVYSQGHRDMSRYNRVYNDLCAVYGTPIAVNDNMFESATTWFGGNRTGYVTLSYGYQSGRYYTTLSVGN